jgi:chromosome segregation ATPase
MKIDVDALRKELNPPTGSKLADSLLELESMRPQVDETAKESHAMHQRLLKASDLARSKTDDPSDVAHARMLLDPLREADKRLSGTHAVVKKRVSDLENHLQFNIAELRSKQEELAALQEEVKPSQKTKGGWIDQPGKSSGYKTLIEDTRPQRIRKLKEFIDRWL